MPEVKWTDEAIENGLEYCRRYEQAGQSDNTSQQLKRALMELKRVRAWVKHGLHDQTGLGRLLNNATMALVSIGNGDPAPGGEEKS